MVNRTVSDQRVRYRFVTAVAIVVRAGGPSAQTSIPAVSCARRPAGISGARRNVKLYPTLIAVAFFLVAGTAAAQPDGGRNSGDEGGPVAAGRAETLPRDDETGQASE